MPGHAAPRPRRDAGLSALFHLALCPPDGVSRRRGRAAARLSPPPPVPPAAAGGARAGARPVRADGRPPLRRGAARVRPGGHASGLPHRLGAASARGAARLRRPARDFRGRLHALSPSLRRDGDGRARAPRGGDDRAPAARVSGGRDRAGLRAADAQRRAHAARRGGRRLHDDRPAGTAAPDRRGDAL